MRQEIHWRVWLIKWAIWRRLLSLILRKMDKAHACHNSRRYYTLGHIASIIRMHLDSLQTEYPE